MWKKWSTVNTFRMHCMCSCALDWVEFMDRGTFCWFQRWRMNHEAPRLSGCLLKFCIRYNSLNTTYSQNQNGFMNEQWIWFTISQGSPRRSLNTTQYFNIINGIINKSIHKRRCYVFLQHVVYFFSSPVFIDSLMKACNIALLKK